MSWRVGATFAALCVIWGLPYFFIKLAVAELPAVVVAWGRITLGAAFLLPVAWHRGSLRGLGSHKGAVCAFAVVELVVPFVLLAVGEQWVSSSLTGILIAAVPLIVLILSPLFGIREPLGPRRVVGLVIGLAGVVVLLGLDAVSGQSGWLGVACVMGAALCYACGALIIQRFLGDADGMGAVAAGLGIASVVLLPAALYWAPSHAPSVRVLIYIAILGGVCSSLALSLFFYLIARIGAARTAVVTYINPAVAALLGVVVLHESFGKGAILGLALILLGSWLGTHSSKPEEPATVKGTVSEAP
jgi:drug/metabolite transporter (DMT)-like permease